MAAFARQNWPATTHACSVVCAAVMFLPIPIMIVTTPSRPLWQVMFDDAVNHFDRVAHDRIVGTPNSKSHKVKKISANYIPGRMGTAAVGDLDHGCIGIRVRIYADRIRGIDSDIVAWKTWNQFAFRRDRPFFKV